MTDQNVELRPVRLVMDEVIGQARADASARNMDVRDVLFNMGFAEFQAAQEELKNAPSKAHEIAAQVRLAAARVFLGKIEDI